MSKMSAKERVTKALTNAKAEGKFLDVSKLNAEGHGYLTLAKEPTDKSPKKKVTSKVYSNTYRGAKNFVNLAGGPKEKKDLEAFAKAYGTGTIERPVSPKSAKKTPGRPLSKKMRERLDEVATDLPSSWAVSSS